MIASVLFHKCIRSVAALIMVLGMTSCATIIKRGSYRLPVTSNRPHSTLIYKDSSYSLPTILRVRRSKEPLALQLISDTGRRSFVVKAVPNTSFLFGNMFGGVFAPAGWLLDMSNPHRFYYGRALDLDACDSSPVIRPQWAGAKLARSYRYHRSRYWPVRRGDVAFRVTLPYVNNFHLRPESEPVRSSTGFWGISAGLDLAHRDRRFVRFIAGAATNFYVPLPLGSMHRSGMFEDMSSVYVGITNNHQYKRLSFGYGAAFARNVWVLDHSYGKRDSVPPTRAPVTKRSHALGLMLSGYYQFGKRFHAGIVYRPTILNLSPYTKLNYEHLISLDFAWSFRLRRIN